MREFKVGDEVVIIGKVVAIDQDDYPVCVKFKGSVDSESNESFTKEGCHLKDSSSPSLFHVDDFMASKLKMKLVHHFECAPVVRSEREIALESENKLLKQLFYRLIPPLAIEEKEGK